MGGWARKNKLRGPKIFMQLTVYYSLLNRAKKVLDRQCTQLWVPNLYLIERDRGLILKR